MVPPVDEAAVDFFQCPNRMFIYSSHFQLPTQQRSGEQRAKEGRTPDQQRMHDNEVGSIPEPELSVVGTVMGSLRPGSNAVLRGFSGSPAVLKEEEEEEEESEDEDEEMPLQSLNPKPVEIATDDVDLDGDEEELQLLYPEPDQEPVVPRAASNSPSASRSVSPMPPLSSARFPPPSTQLTVVDAHTGAGPTSNESDAGIVARFLQSCERLGEDMRALRSEVALLRAAHTPIPELEERVRALEERRVRPASVDDIDAARAGAGAGRRWSHPLQHLLAPGSAMEVDGVVEDGETLSHRDRENSITR
ncbi:hypothetical protein B0H12DRAFT_742598 [Mycena haematopus]|nr:hypothetical protein B0H12DRAFT_742598 [Mycena haematopus]